MRLYQLAARRTWRFSLAQAHGTASAFLLLRQVRGLSPRAWVLQGVLQTKTKQLWFGLRELREE